MSVGGEGFDDAVVGAGILGLAHAYLLAARGRRVIVFERGPRALGASIRNFGMIWPVGQPRGPLRRLALRSRGHWLEVLSRSGLWHECSGSLHLAHHEDEALTLQEFIGAEPSGDFEWLEPKEVAGRSSAARVEGLIGALWSPSEVCVDPREVLAHLPAWLQRELGVRFEFGCAVTACDPPALRAGERRFSAERVFVCPGDDLQTLFPEVFATSDLLRCKLQMMRSDKVENGWRQGPMLAAGLTLVHYRSFQDCQSLPALRRRLALERPEHLRYGIHVLVAQNGSGEITLGDSHEYGGEITPFDKSEIDELVLRYLDAFFKGPPLRIASRWHGTYVKHPTDPWFIARPAPGVTLVTGLGGAGMTLSFGLAEQVVREALGEAHVAPDRSDQPSCP